MTYKIDSIYDIEALPYTVKYIGECTPKSFGTLCDRWLVSICGLEFDFYTGTGHRRVKAAAPPAPTNIKTVAYAQWASAYLKPVQPNILDVIGCLAMDSAAFTQSFYNWCEEYGYNTNDNDAISTYRECIKNAEKMLQVFSRQDIQKIAELTADL